MSSPPAHPMPDRSGEHGFTLMEVLVVIVIMGILLAITVGTLQGSRETRAKRAGAAVALAYQEAIEQYAADHNGRYPRYPNAQDWADDKGPINRFGARKAGASAAYYLRAVPSEVSSGLVQIGTSGTDAAAGVGYTRLDSGTGYRLDVRFDGELHCSIGTAITDDSACA